MNPGCSIQQENSAPQEEERERCHDLNFLYTQELWGSCTGEEPRRVNWSLS